MEVVLETKLGKLIYGDAKDILQELPENSIDLVITDPPYPKKYFCTYQYLADYCPRLMKHGSSLLTIVPHYSLPDVVKCFEGKLKYRWLLHMNQLEGSHSRMAMGIEVTYKPILWYVKDSYPSGRGFIKDGVVVMKDKQLHKWQQSLEWLEYYIPKLSKENDIVLDPYIGSGSLAVVCEKLNRKWIGIDNDLDACNIAKERILNDKG